MASSPTDPPADARKRHRQSNNSDIDSEQNGASKKFKCEPCNKSFTQHKSLLRHQRENKNHRYSRLAISYEHVCDMCLKAFPRAHDLERHRQEQHLGGKIACETCGKLIRAKTPHKNPSGIPCSLGRYPQNATQDDAPILDETWTDLSRPQCISEEVCTSVMDSLTQQLSKASLGTEIVMNMATYRKQIRTKLSHRLLPCGICHTEFEVNDCKTLLRHLKAHFESFRDQYRCVICDINFVHEPDLKRHQLSAAAGDCGFNFVHKAPCPGHHRPPGLHMPRGSPCKSDDDRFNFAYRLRTWEHAQLNNFLSNLAPLVERKLEQGRGGSAAIIVRDEMMSRPIKSVPLRVEYNSPPRRDNEERNACSAKSSTIRRLWKAPLRQLQLGLPDKMLSVQLLSDEFLQLDFLNRMLWESASFGDLDQAAFALSCGADVNARNNVEATALHLAICSRSTNVVSLLLEAGADVSNCNRSGEPALMCAIAQKSMEMVRVLMRHRPVDCSAKHMSAIIHAALPPTWFASEDETIEMLSFLIKHGASVNAPNVNGKTALECATKFEYWKVMKFLLDSGVNLIQQPKLGSKCMMNAVESRHWEAAVLLIANGAVIKERHVENAIWCRADEQLVGLLLDNCANVLDSFRLHELLLDAILGCRSIDIVKLLVKRGAHLDPIYQIEHTCPLLKAAVAGRLDIITYLIAEGARLDIALKKQTVGSRSLCHAIVAGRTDIMQLLLSCGATANDEPFDYYGGGDHTMLCHASRRGKLNCTQLLVVHGANMEATCANGETALASAALNGEAEIVKFLLSCGAQVDIKDWNGHHLFCEHSYWRSRKNSSLACLLLEAAGHQKVCTGCLL